MRVLGLDVSKDAVAGVEVETAFGRFEVREMQELPVPASDINPGMPFEVAAQMLDERMGTFQKLVTSAPIELSTFRNLSVASRDKRAIKSALEFELEDDLPFEKESLHYDSVVFESGSQGSQVHVAASKKENFDPYLKSILSYGIDPDLITTDAWAYRSLFTRIQKAPLKGEAQPPVLLFGFERQKCFFYVHHKNKPVLYREISFGLSTLERKLNETLGATSEELRSWIQDIGVSGADEQVSNAMSDALEDLVPELKQVELSTHSLEREAFQEVLVTGEGALIPGILEWIEGVVGKPVNLFRPLSLLSQSKISYSEHSEIRYAKALALAFANLPADKLPSINLRKGIFAKLSAGKNSPLELIKKPLPYLLVILGVFFITKTIEYQYYKDKATESDEALKKSVKSYFNVTSDTSARTYLSDISKLKKTVEKDLAKERELGKLFAPSANSPLDLLKSLSQKMGKDMVVDLVSFESGADYTDKYVENKPLKTTLTFVIASPQVLAKVTDLIERNYGLKKGLSEEVTSEGHKAYRVSFSGTLGAAK